MTLQYFIDKHDKLQAIRYRHLLSMPPPNYGLTSLTSHLPLTDDFWVLSD